jgi:uncharacterized protein (TIRG00374 family)
MAESNQTPVKRRLRAVYWAASLGLAGGLLYYSLRGIDWLQVWGILREARLAVMALAAGLLSLSVFIRAYRWRVLLSAEGRIPISLTFWATSAGYLGNNVLPARAGEVVRTLMVSRQSGMSKTFVLTTALSERVADAIALLTISSMVLLTLPNRPGWLAHAARPIAVLGVTGVAAIALLPPWERFWLKFLAWTPMPGAFREQAEGTLRHVLRGIRSFHDRGRLGRFLALTAIVWCLDGITTVVLASAIGMSITLPIAFLLIAGLGLGSAMPSTPGYVGIYQFAAVSILTPFGYSRTDAIAYILLVQAISYVVLAFWGLIGLGLGRDLRIKDRLSRCEAPSYYREGGMP